MKYPKITEIILIRYCSSGPRHLTNSFHVQVGLSVGSHIDLTKRYVFVLVPLTKPKLSSVDLN